MSILDQLERRLEKYSIENVTNYLIGGQVLAAILIYSSPSYAQYFILQGNYLLKGELWRVITFLFMPISQSPIFAIFAWYLFYLLGNELESRWGFSRYVLYLLIAYSGTIILAFLFPNVALSNGYIYTSLFFAFAYLYPNFTLLIFFILPVKVKWLALLAWIGLAAAFLLGDLPTKIITVVSVSNFLIFFGKDLKYSIRNEVRRTSQHVTRAAKSQKPHHVCTVCGKNEITDPDMGIRYCNMCVPSVCYCNEHIHTHTHKKLPN